MQPARDGNRPEFKVSESLLVNLLHGSNRFRYSCGRSFRHDCFPIATFLNATSDGAEFTALLNDKCGSALRARFGNRKMRRREVAFWIFIATVEGAPSAFFGDSFHQFAGLALRAFDS
jgi:hypothetical protein